MWYFVYRLEAIGRKSSTNVGTIIASLPGMSPMVQSERSTG